MMQYRRFGRTELPMPVYTCGAMRFQQSWKDEPFDQITLESQQKMEACIERALALGINHIETARGYGSSEVQLGQILPALPRQELIVQTKIGPATEEEFLKTFDLSMSRLQLDYVDLLSVHGINNRDLLDLTLAPNGPLKAIRRLQAEGRVRHVGFSTHGSCEDITAAIDTGEFDYVNLHWYWINQSNWSAIEAASRRDMGVFIISPNDKGGKLYAPSDKLRDLCAPWSPMVFNDLFCLLHPQVHTLSHGVAFSTEFDEHMRALSLWPQAQEIVDTVGHRLQQALEDSLGHDWLAHWQEGIPGWEQIPGGVNVWEIVRLWTYAKGLDMVDFGKMRYNLLGQAEHWFPGQNSASFDRTEMRRTLQHSPFADRLPEILTEAHTLLFEKPIERLSKSD